ncbi:hypothetical protein [Flavobacterium sp.]|uniref:hypothetical protein n=1 Tax=Flavobacterium sp. TaxID=239 RepID=UPI00121D7041|nr:hypothetical protein [Flavobacterium sp.]RZJ70368.1 MAG: hypothetical protein EOO49_13885 [Flavobacterium sp.]
MKTFTLLVATIFLMGSQMKASEKKLDFGANYPVAIADAEPIVFKERGIEFYVFADGQLDFNTVPSVAGSDYYYKGRRGGTNNTYGAPGVNNNGGVRIEHDAYGRIRRIGNVFLNYDTRGRVKRIGSVYMSYNRYALMQVGGLRILYDRYGRIVGTQGRVNGGSDHYYNQDDYYQGQGGYNSGSNNSDDDYYYYKQDGTKEKIEPKVEVRK